MKIQGFQAQDSDSVQNRLADCSKLTINWKNINDVTFLRDEIIVKFFFSCFTSGPSFISVSYLVLEF